jgi:hypothetical protein
MKKVKRSEYISYSRTIVSKLKSEGRWGKGSMYEKNVLTGLPDKGIGSRVLDALRGQKIILRKRHKHGWKYYLNKERRDKIDQIAKETGRGSIIVALLKL